MHVELQKKGLRLRSIQFEALRLETKVTISVQQKIADF